MAVLGACYIPRSFEGMVVGRKFIPVGRIVLLPKVVEMLLNYG